MRPFPYDIMPVYKKYSHSIVPVSKIYPMHKIYPTYKALETAKLGYQLDLPRTKKPQLKNYFLLPGVPRSV